MDQAENTPMELPQENYPLGPKYESANMSEVKSTYREELMQAQVPRPDGWLDIDSLTTQLKGSYTGKELNFRLNPEAAFARLKRILSFVIFTQPLEKLSEEEIVSKSGYSRDGVTHSFNKHKVVKQLVTSGLVRMQSFVSFALQQILVIHTMSLKSAHASLAPFFPLAARHKAFHQKLDTVYEGLLRNSLTEAKKEIDARIMARTTYVSADLPIRHMILVGLTPMLQDVLRTDPKAAYHEEKTGENETNESGIEAPRVAKQRQAVLNLKKSLYLQRAHFPFEPIDFVEGGHQDWHTEEYRSINVKELNRMSEQYFTIVKGQLILEIESILDNTVHEPLKTKEKIRNSMREVMLEARLAVSLSWSVHYTNDKRLLCKRHNKRCVRLESFLLRV